jgi:uncharacterized protein (TIGR02145 family)
MFNPLVAGIGFHQVLYTYINAYSCPGVGSSTIRVVPDPVFSCNDMFTDVRDGHQYATYKLPNGKCWMAENLVYGETLMSAFPQTDNCRSEKYCANDNGLWCLLRGGFYQWEELMEYDPTPGTKGICPPGWHIPAADEWNELLDFNMGASQAAGPLKDLYLVNGFHAKPGGFNYLDYLWTFGGWPLSATFFWTSTPSGATSAFARGLNNNNPSISLYPGSRANAFSVRCVKD